MSALEMPSAESGLGARCTDKGTVFRVWQPLAESAALCLYENGAMIRKHEMRRSDGVFECRARGDLDGVEYAFEITRNGETVLCADIYAKAVTADGKRSVAVNMARHAPKSWDSDKPVSFPDAESAVICEMSVRDFSADGRADFKNRGKFAALCEKNVRNSHGDIVGLQYLKKLGVTHIQLMPVFDFDMDGGEYNWGYNPRFYNAPCAYYAQNDGVRELRELVAAAHKAGLGVIADVVYNHVFDVESSAFQRTFPEYYFRTDSETGELSNGSGCGNEFASERPMARKFITDSLLFLAREYHLDGFRFDLMGLLDIRTLRFAERRLLRINPDILLYGEGWTGGASPLPESERAVQSSALTLPGFAFFNDSFRDAIKGSVFSAEDRGYVNGCPDDERFERIKAALAGEYPDDFWTDDSSRTLNYAECHDNLTLFDKLSVTLNGDTERVIRAEKMTAALIFLSRGMTFMQLGQEFLRTKNGAQNSYDLPDEVNAINWNALSENRGVADYYAGLIAFRKRYFKDFGERRFERLGGGFVMTAGKFVLIVSPTDEELRAETTGTFRVYADENSASDKALYTAKQLCCAGHSILLARKIK